MLRGEGGGVREALVSARVRARPGPKQKELFAPPKDAVLEELERLDIDSLTPLQALQLLAKWKTREHR
jgi:hypothetical protein